MQIRLPQFLTACFMTLTCFSGCNETPQGNQQELSVPFGTYAYTYEDGSVSQIIVDETSFMIQNGDYQYCPSIAALTRIEDAVIHAQAEGLALSEDAQKQIAEEAKSLDFSSYDHVAVPYHLELVDVNVVNLVAEDENHEKIWGLQLTYYADDSTIGFGDGYYVLQ